MEFILWTLRSLRARGGTISKRSYRSRCGRRRQSYARWKKGLRRCAEYTVGSLALCYVLCVMAALTLYEGRARVTLALLLTTIAILARSM